MARAVEAVNRIVLVENFGAGGVRRDQISESYGPGVAAGSRPWITDTKRCARRQLKQRQEQNAILLPNLLPNAVGQRGKETDAERSDTEEVPINRGFPAGVGT
jgi:hypothetical protein